MLCLVKSDVPVDERIILEQHKTILNCFVVILDVHFMTFCVVFRCFDVTFTLSFVVYWRLISCYRKRNCTVKEIFELLRSYIFRSCDPCSQCKYSIIIFWYSRGDYLSSSPSRNNPGYHLCVRAVVWVWYLLLHHRTVWLESQVNMSV